MCSRNIGTDYNDPILQSITLSHPGQLSIMNILLCTCVCNDYISGEGM